MLALVIADWSWRAVGAQGRWLWKSTEEGEAGPGGRRLVEDGEDGEEEKKGRAGTD